MDHFEVFGLPRRIGIDVEALQRRFYELSRRWHPDFHSRATAAEQAAVLEASARLNTAYRTLRDPIARIEYLVRLEEGRDTKEGAVEKPQAPPQLLAEMFEIQEALAEARAAGRLDDEMRATLAGRRERLVERFADIEAELTGPTAARWDAGDRSALEAFKQGLAARAYLRTVIEDLNRALGESEGSAEGTGKHVTHHRH
jgi:molecular chaperone HscB